MEKWVHLVVLGSISQLACMESFSNVCIRIVIIGKITGKRGFWDTLEKSIAVKIRKLRFFCM